MSHFTIPEHVLIGKDAIHEAMPYLKEYGKRTMIVTGKHVGKSPMMDIIVKELQEAGIAYYIFDDITGEPTNVMIEEGVKCFQRFESEFVIGIGGGSPLDSAKAIAAMSVLEGSISDYNGVEIIGEIPPIVAIPTTAGTGSEATKFTVITDVDKDIKMLLKGECLIPKLAVLNYEFTVDMPKSVTAATGLDALTHAVEAYTSKKAFALTDVYAVSAVKRIMKYLPIAYHNGFDGKAREEMSLAAFEAGVCINNSSVTLVHGMSRPIGALFHVPHGLSNAMLLKDCLGFALDGAYDRFGNLGRAIGVAAETDTDQAASEQFLKAVEAVCLACEVPTLKEYAIKEEEFLAVIPKMAKDAVASGSPGNTIKMVTEEDCISLYKKVYLGK